MKTPEQLADEYTKDWWGNLPEAEAMRKSARENFLAGYQARQEQEKAEKAALEYAAEAALQAAKHRLSAQAMGWFYIEKKDDENT